MKRLLSKLTHMDVQKQWTYPTESEKLLTHCLFAVSHILTVLSSLHDTISLPSGENLAQRTQCVCRYKEYKKRWRYMFHTLMDLSSEAVTRNWPSAEKSTLRTGAV